MRKSKAEKRENHRSQRRETFDDHEKSTLHERPEPINNPPDSRPDSAIIDGESCDHPGCLSHVTHPCELCGRIAGLYPESQWIKELEENANLTRNPKEGDLFLNKNSVVIWFPHDKKYDPESIWLDGRFTTQQLKDLFTHMERYSGTRI